MVKKSKYIQAFFLGKIDYLSAMRLQEKINTLVFSNKISQTILFLEHDNVLTYGSSEKISELEIDKLNQLNNKFTHVKTNRGGQITLHSPGQLICYPIINLKEHFSGVLDYVQFLEKTIIETLSHYNIKSHTVQQRRGIWVNGDPKEKYLENINPSGEKIAALGLKIIKYITLHGFSLNVNNDLSLFNSFVPCGMENLRVNSINNLLSKTVEVEEVSKKVSLKMSEILQIPIVFKSDIDNEIRILE
jgi:lipoate-protein ligase B